MMSSPFNSWLGFALFPALHLLAILVFALLLNRFLRQLTNRLIRPATSQARAAQSHEQQTRTMANTAYQIGRGVVWTIAVLTALPEFGIAVWPAVLLAGAVMLALGIGAQDTVRDFVAGCCILSTDQYAPGDTIQAGDTVGRVEQLTLRRTVVRDARGALVTLGNGTLRAVGNLSRDWSQAFVDISVALDEPLDRTLQALEAASAGLRSDPAWAQALVDGPRVLGIQEYGPAGSTLRLQVRTAPMRQEEVARELRRRVQVEFQRHSIALPGARGIEQAGAFHAIDDLSKAEPAS
jgi:moderate conductance mechanosensitive channel